jgi:hypothetical protein
MEMHGDSDQAAELLQLSMQVTDDAGSLSPRKPFFAIDSNVAIFLSQPSEEASANVRQGTSRVGLGAIFRSDPPELSKVVAHALAEHLYTNLRREAPLLLIPPMAHELHQFARRMTRSVAAPADDEMKRWRTEGTKLLLKLERLGAFSGEAETLLRSVQDVLFLRYGPSSSLRRLRHMLGQRHIISSDVASSSSDLQIPEDIRAALTPPSSAREMIKAAVEAQTWMDAGLERRGPNAFSDAFVLARIEDINRRLEAVGSEFVLIFITADRWLINVIQENARPYVQARHPRGWLTQLQIFQRNDEDDRTSLSDLLKLAVHAPLDKAGGRSGEHVLINWQSYLAKATASFVPSDATRELFFDQDRDVLERYESAIERFHSDLTFLQEKAWEDCFAVSAITAAAEAQRTSRDFPRNVPPLVLEGWETTQSAINTFLKWHNPEDFDLAFFNSALASIMVEDPSGYARYLCLAVIFASRGDWDVAASLSRRASERVREGSSSFAGPNGREASFLEAVALRHTARSEREIQASEAMLGRAVEISRAEQQARTEWDIVPERFEAERLALRLSKHYLRRYMQPGSARVPASLAEVTELSQQVGRFLNNLFSAYRDSMETAQSRSEVLRKLLLRAIINALGMAVTHNYNFDSAVAAWSIAEKLGITTNLESADVSNVGRISIIAYRRLFVQRSGSDTALLRQLMSARERHQVFPYDAARFDEISRNLHARR